MSPYIKTMNLESELAKDEKIDVVKNMELLGVDMRWKTEEKEGFLGKLIYNTSAGFGYALSFGLAGIVTAFTLPAFQLLPGGSRINVTDPFTAKLLAVIGAVVGGLVGLGVYTGKKTEGYREKRTHRHGPSRGGAHGTAGRWKGHSGEGGHTDGPED